MDAGIRGVYEDNITGSSADIGKEGDYYAVASVSIGGYKNIGSRTYVFLRGNAGGYLYRRYSDLDAAIIGMSGGIYKEFNSVVSASALVTVKREEYHGEGRSSTAYGGNLNLRQKINRRIWIKESYEFEKNVAALDIFGYDGNLAGVSIGYSVVPGTTAIAGYSYLYRSYEEPAGFRNIFHTISLGLMRELVKKVSLGVTTDSISAQISPAATTPTTFSALVFPTATEQ